MQRNRTQRGNAVIELALVTPIVFLMLFGAMDFARVFATTDILTGVARSAAQQALTSPGRAGDSAGITAAGTADAQGMTGVTITPTYYCKCTTGGANVTCGTTASCGGTAPMMYVKTTATANFSTLLTYPGVSNPISLTGSAEMRAQ